MFTNCLQTDRQTDRRTDGRRPDAIAQPTRNKRISRSVAARQNESMPHQSLKPRQYAAARYKTDHSLIEIIIDNKMQQKGPGYFKLNNSMLLNDEYQHQIKQKIHKVVENNTNCNPNTLWEVIKGTNAGSASLGERFRCSSRAT
ncbi:hypothetical protein DPMN_162444 [Dreissena polymorpha]|uniref:Uncharacterized protein n=1 Tax=Dreissena polymorpha TaxID=45954 RepID=A0A9D4ITK9_DREPO|nr:hypothetical protein DPMN_162444 [Dreissena polymorpha]